MTIILSLLACAPSDAGIDSQPASDTGALEYVAPVVPDTAFQCDSIGNGLADIPPGAWSVGTVALVGCDGGQWTTDEWSLSATRIIVSCREACSGVVAWNEAG